MTDAPEKDQEDAIRLQKYLSTRGLASRRHAAEMIKAGRVTVDGSVALEPGTRVDPGTSTVALDGTAVPAQRPDTRTLMLNKPPGYICSRSSKQGKTVYDLLGSIADGLVTVGRLDKESEGLLLMTNDGALAEHLTHPRHGSAKVYDVEVRGKVTDAILRRLGAPMILDGYQTRPVEVARLTSDLSHGVTPLRITLREGRNRQIRNMCRVCGLHVERLKRIALSSLSLGTLDTGAFRPLSPRELTALRKTSPA